MPMLTIDGRTVQAEPGLTLLQTARRADIYIPTLCDHPALEPWGGCRLCMVELSKPSWNGASKIVVSCMAPAEAGLVVQTQSDAVVAARKVIVDLLLARCPQTPLVRSLAREYGIEASSFAESEKRTDCIQCGLCVRVCEHTGHSAISTIGRGATRQIAPPLQEAPPDCVGCLACAEVCPTRCIPYSCTERTRTIWGKQFELPACASCGQPLIPEEQVRALIGKGFGRQDLELCEACKRRRTADAMAEIAGIGPVLAG